MELGIIFREARIESKHQIIGKLWRVIGYIVEDIKGGGEIHRFLRFR